MEGRNHPLQSTFQEDIDSDQISLKEYMGPFTCSEIDRQKGHFIGGL